MSWHGASGDFDLNGTDCMGVQFTNDRCERGPDSRMVGDRNLYVDAVTANGDTNGTDQSLWSAGTVYWDC